MRTFIWSEGLGQGAFIPYLSVVNHSDQVMTVEHKLKLDGEGPVITFHRNVAPWTRDALNLTDAVKGRHFWLSVRLDQPGAATLTVWRPDYAIPPYTPPPSIIDAA